MKGGIKVDNKIVIVFPLHCRLAKFIHSLFFQFAMDLKMVSLGYINTHRSKVHMEFFLLSFSDLEARRDVKREEGEAFAREHGLVGIMTIINIYFDVMSINTDFKNSKLIPLLFRCSWKLLPRQRLT